MRSQRNSARTELNARVRHIVSLVIEKLQPLKVNSAVRKVLKRMARDMLRQIGAEDRTQGMTAEEVDQEVATAVAAVAADALSA